MRTAVRTPAAVLLLLAVLLAGAGVLRAASAPPASPQEQANAVAATIRCPTCQGLSVKDSPAVLAAGSRQIIADQLAQGRTPDQVRQFFVDRYGPTALLSPPSSGPGLLAWVLPGAALAAAGGLLLRWLRTARARAPVPPDPAVALPVHAAAAGPGAAAAPGAPVEAVVPDQPRPQRPDAVAATAASALAAHRAGTLVPDDTAAGAALRAALDARAVAEQAGDAAAITAADARLAAAYRRVQARRAAGRRSGAGGRLPRRAVTVAVVVAVLAGTGAALAVGVRERAAGDLPTGDLPGPAAPAPAGLDTLLAATKERPQDSGAWTALGRAYEAAGELAEALAAYDRALALDPTGDDVALLRAGVLVQGGSAADALPTLQRLAAAYPDDPQTVLLLGSAQQAVGAPQAEATLRRFLELVPTGPDADAVRALLARP